MDETISDALRVVDPALFRCIQDLDLSELQNHDISTVLPYLVKLLLNPYYTNRKQVLKLIYPNRQANDVFQLLQTRAIELQDLNLNATKSPDHSSFESACPEDQIKMVATEFIRIQDLARQSTLNSDRNHNFKLQSSPLFDNPLYVEEIILCFFALLSKSTTIPVMNILDVSEALLHVKHGPTYIVRLIFNMPERCQEVCHSLINFGEQQDECEKVNEISEQRAQTIRALCRLNPSLAFMARSLTLQMRKMPSLTIMITLDQLSEPLHSYSKAIDSQMTDGETMDDATCDKLKLVIQDLENSFSSAISFIIGILLGSDEQTRTWFSQYIKSAQQKRIDQSHHTILSTFRSVLLTCVQKLFPCFLDMDHPTEETVSTYKIDESESDSAFLNRKLIQATSTLRAYCALRGIGLLKLNQTEHEVLLRLVTCRQVANTTSINLATTGVCTLLVCSSMINNQKDEKRAAEWLKWLIKESHYSEGSYANHGKCSISELLLLIAIHFQNNHTNQIAELVHATLGLKLQAKFSVTKCKSLFVQEVFTDQMIAEHAVKVPVTKGLDNTIKEFLPIHCIHQLLESRSFSKHQVPIEDWIFKQICESKKPIHHMLPELIGAYVNSIMISTSVHGPCGTNQPISEARIVSIFKLKLYYLDKDDPKSVTAIQTNGTKSPLNSAKKKKRGKKDKLDMDQAMEICDELAVDDSTNNIDDIKIIDVEAAQVLVLYYLMLYEEVRLREIRKMDHAGADRSKLLRYSSELMMDVPVFYLLQLVRDNQDLFGPILPPLLRLFVIQYPHLCSIQHWMNTSEIYEPYKSKDVTSGSMDLCDRTINTTYSPNKRNQCDTGSKILSKQTLLDQMIDGFACTGQQPVKLARTLATILTLPRDEIWTFAEPFIAHWTRVLQMHPSESSDHAKLMELTTRLWWKFNTIFPSKLWVSTINSLRMIQNGVKIGSIKSLEYTWNELVSDPLIVLRCDNRVFRNPAYLNILMHMLTAFLAASKRCLQDQISEQGCNQKDTNRDKTLEELKTTLVLAQTSAAIQILLESCLPTSEECKILNKKETGGGQLTQEDEFVLDQLDASTSCICEHLHQVFIADTNLAKLVHFQTYPSELLAMTSDKIPSMHICLDFIPELLSQPDSSKQVFVIELASHLCEKYAITKSLNVAKLCFNVAYTLLQLVPSEKRAQFYIPVLPALLRICKTFPILQEDARIILNQINQITIAHLASTSSRLSLSTSKPSEGLEKMSWQGVKKLMQSLDAHESLYICIQKCLLDLDHEPGLLSIQ